MEKGKTSDLHRDIESPLLIKISEMIDSINKSSRASSKSFNECSIRHLMNMENLITKIYATKNYIKSSMRILEILQKKMKKIEEYSIMMECQGFPQNKNIRSRIEDIKNKQDSQYELEKYRKALEIHEKYLGISIKIQKNIVSFYFSHMGDGSSKCSFSVIRNGINFKLNQCTPFVPSINNIVENFNIFEDFSGFLKEARKAFSKHLKNL